MNTNSNSKHRAIWLDADVHRRLARLAYQRSIAEGRRATLKELVAEALTTFLEAVELPGQP